MIYLGKLANNWTPAPGLWRNFNFQLDLTGDSVQPHTINPDLSQLFIDQYLFWSNFRDEVTGFYCDGQSTTSGSTCSGFDVNYLWPLFYIIYFYKH